MHRNKKDVVEFVSRARFSWSEVMKREMIYHYKTNQEKQKVLQTG